jgi:solute carrier family 25 phosphate transporter 3
MEMVKVKVQTSVPGTFPTAVIPATIAMNANRQVTRFPYGSIIPLWSRQIPYTVTKFYFFEKVDFYFIGFCFIVIKIILDCSTVLYSCIYRTEIIVS